MFNKLFNNLINSLNGLRVAIKEHSFALELLMGLFILPLIILGQIDFFLKIIILILYFILLSFEIINTSIEKLCDKITTDIDKDIKDIKDLASASVFIILILLLSLLFIAFLY
tara:strand:- start:380 stop:718 length:339 start_codon:yes stop_codon:yes gene_type:complete